MGGEEIRSEFPFFSQERERMTYLDNGATTQKPQVVIDRLVRYYTLENANIHRGDYPLSNRAECMYEHARGTVAGWLEASEPEEIVFTRGSTEAINLAAACIGESWLKPGDNIVVTELEHSSNYFPWKRQCEKRGACFRTAQAGEKGTLEPEAVAAQMDERTRLVAITAMSNVTGFRPDVGRVIQMAHEKGIPVLVDASQELAHHRVSVRKLDCDFLVFSGHKVYGPMGVGVLYGRRRWLDELQPYLYGGGMVQKRDCGCIAYREDPGKYEAGTQNIAGVLGLEAALEFLQKHDFDEAEQYERRLGRYLCRRLEGIAGIRLAGPQADSPVQVFEAEWMGAYDVGVFLGNRGIAVRSGAHCAYPLMERMGKESLCRVSLAWYNTAEEIDRLAEALEELQERFGKRDVRNRQAEACMEKRQNPLPEKPGRDEGKEQAGWG